MEYNTLLQIAKDYGSTVYVYDAEKIVSQYNLILFVFKKMKTK